MKQILLTKLAVLILTVSVTSNFKVDVRALRERISVIVQRHECRIKDELAAFGVSPISWWWKLTKNRSKKSTR